MAEKRAAGGSTSTSAPALVSKRAARRAEKRKRKEAAAQRHKAKAHTATAAGQQRGRRVVRDLGGSILNAPDATKSSSAATTPAAQDLETIDYQSLAGLKPKAVGAFEDKSLTGGKKKKKSP